MLVSVGRLHHSKGFPIVVDALAALGSRFEDVRLFIIGGPDSEADARPAIASAVARHGLHRRVFLTGVQTREQLVDWYSAADLFCLATTREGSPNVLLEAQACGLPCVATSVGGNPEVIASSELGILSRASANKMAEAIAAAFSRQWNRSEIAARARHRTWCVVADECRLRLTEAVRISG